MRLAATGKRQEHGSVEASSASAGWLRSIRFSGFTVLMFTVMVLFVVIVAPGLRIFIEQRQQIADLQRSVELKQSQNTELNAEVARWSDPAYIRAEARERLYYVLPGETSFLVIDDTTPADTVSNNAPVSATVQPTTVDWMSALFVSALTAGLSNQTPAQLEGTTEISP